MAQPDFNVLWVSMTNAANGLRNAAAGIDSATTEIDKIQNLPPANIAGQLDQILLQMAQMGQNLVELRQDVVEIRQDMARMEQNMHQHLLRSELNQLARISNSRVAHESHRLEPLYGFNNNLIEDFPQTSADINALDAVRTDALLQELGLPVNGILDAKKKRLRRYIGLMVL